MLLSMVTILPGLLGNIPRGRAGAAGATRSGRPRCRITGAECTSAADPEAGCRIRIDRRQESQREKEKAEELSQGVSMAPGPERPDAAKGDQRSPDAMD